MRLVLVKWSDPNSTSGWQDRTEILEKALARDRGCKTAGWVIHEDDELLVVAGSIGATDSDQIGDVFEIPRRVIDSVTDLDEVYEELHG